MWPGKWALLFLLGVLLGVAWPATWLSWAGWLLGAIVLLSLLPWLVSWPWIHPYRLLIWLTLGLAWSLAAVLIQDRARLPVEWQQTDLLVSGVIVGLPERTETGWRFTFKLDQEQTHPNLPGRLRLNWRGERELNAGERWDLVVRLRRPHGNLNPGGFDYEKWLFRHRIGATGYVRDDPRNQLRAKASAWSLSSWREGLRARIDQALADRDERGLIRGLAIGDRSAISDQQWEVLLATGTNHLLAISGLHVGIVAGLAASVVLAWWRRVPRWARVIPSQKAAAVAALLAGAFYALLAGFSIPTQRAVIMLAVGLSGILLARHWRPVDLLLLAAVAVVLIDPFAVLDVGFWLSFAAVAIILFLLVGRDRVPGMVHSLILIQLALFVGLLPWTAGFFERVAWTAPLANLVAVPLVSFVVVPLALLGTVLLLVPGPIGAWVLWLAAVVLQGLMWLLDGFASLPIERQLPAVSTAALLLAVIGGIWLMMPRQWPARWLGVLLFLPLLLPRSQLPPYGYYDLLALDVGQGLSIVVRTRHHSLVYDTGPSWRSGSDAGERIVVPALHALGIRKLDGLIISHEHDDHAGGADAVIRRFRPDWIIAGQPQSHAFESEQCVDGHRWEWDGVIFETRFADRARSANDASCVLKISGRPMTALLTGDIEWLGERLLMVDGRLEADLLLVPHHGSRTSSDEKFLDAVSPSLAWVSTGYLNRQGHPHAEVVKRYQARQIPLYNTAFCGALRLKRDGRTYCFRRDGYPWIWRHRVDVELFSENYRR